ncbi:MAG: hypothetical protein J5864_08235 [Oscillospiraceae bacterium]|nr:hypothetical protein [Oscillospiraceae bacterium]
MDMNTSGATAKKAGADFAEGKAFTRNNFQFMELLSHLADTSDPYDFGCNFTDDGEWIVDPADIDHDYNWKARLESLGARKKIGNDEVGYVEVPVSWVEYDPDGENNTDLVRFSDVLKKEFVFLTKVPCKGGDCFNSFFFVFQNCRKSSDCRITCTFRSEIEGKPCYRIDVYYKSTETYLSAWVTEGTDDYSYYLSVEYKDINKSELARTYSLPDQ